MLARVRRRLPILTACLAASLTGASPAPGAGPAVRLVVLGVAQDGGVPHAGCTRACCAGDRRERVVSLGLVDEAARKWWLFEATPDFPDQWRRMQTEAPGCTLAGIFLTHAHMGHYTGLMHLGREVMGARDVPVHAMPRMWTFLESNGPWDQLVRLGNIVFAPLAADTPTVLTPRLAVTPFSVPHRDEYSETVGFLIEGPSRRVAFVPDIDKWERWDRPVEDLVRSVDDAYLDATFFDGSELPGRDIREIPHPLMTESLDRLARLTPDERARVRFIHLNHTNPAFVPGSEAERRVRDAGCSIAREGEVCGL
jgi:pyrroloquinoline quinone biosynthesis protein B